jgi:hypothetical protein
MHERKQKLEGGYSSWASTAAEIGPSAFFMEEMHER